MTQVIDHAILIPALPRVVWDRISRPDLNPRWQADCESISYLNTLRAGPGMRWRSTSASGQEFVIEIQSWYEGLGFEYIIVDGAPFKSNRGRLRLQETAEGTVVQWTLTYEVKGALAGLRNSLSIKRSFNQNIVDSLKNLYQMVRSEGAEPAADVKSLMRDAPSVEERTKYKPRHPSVMEQIEKGERKPVTIEASGDALFKRPIVEDASVSSVTISEPPVADEDTKPNRPVAAAPVVTPAPEPVNEAIPAPPTPSAHDIEEPAFLSEVPSAIPAADSHQPVTAPAEASSSAPVQAADTRQSTEIPAVQTAPSFDPLTEVKPAPAEPAAITPAPEPEQAEPPTPSVVTASDEDRPRSIHDTGRVSVFEIFGLQKPSETQELRAVLQDSLVGGTRSTSTATQEMIASPLKRRGLRAFQRRRRLKLRFPY